MSANGAGPAGTSAARLTAARRGSSAEDDGAASARHPLRQVHGAEDGEGSAEPVAKRRRVGSVEDDGRQSEEEMGVEAQHDATTAGASASTSTPAAKRGPGRPRKNAPNPSANAGKGSLADGGASTSPDAPSSSVKRAPGRPPRDPKRPPAPSTIMTPERREANRLAAERSRHRRAERANILEVMAKGLANENEQLKERVRGLVALGLAPRASATPAALADPLRSVVDVKMGDEEGGGKEEEGSRESNADESGTVPGNAGQPAKSISPPVSSSEQGGTRERHAVASGHENVSGKAGSKAAAHRTLGELANVADPAGASDANDHDPTTSATSPQSPRDIKPQATLPLPLPIPSLNQEMEDHFRAEIQRLRGELQRQEEGGNDVPVDSETSTDNRVDSQTVSDAASAEIEIEALHEIALALGDDVADLEARNEALRAELFEVEVEEAREVEAARTESDANDERRRKDVRRNREMVENALIDVKKHVNLMISFYNPSFIPTDLAPAEAFTLPEKFEPIPLPQPQKRGRPANPQGRKVRARASSVGGATKPVTSDRAGPATAAAPATKPSTDSTPSAPRRVQHKPVAAAAADGTASTPSSSARTRRRAEPPRRYRIEGEPDVLYVEEREIVPGSNEEIIKVSTRKVYNPRPNSSAGRRKKQQPQPQSQAQQAQNQQHPESTSGSFYDAPSAEEANSFAHEIEPHSATSLSFGQVDTLLAAAGIASEAFPEEAYGDFLAPGTT